jgi:hypothetical protein
MPDLSFAVEKAEAVRFAAVPSIGFTLHVENAAPEEAIHTVVLRSQIQIEVARRRYTAEEQGRLHDLFDGADRWGQTLRNLHWTNASAVAGPFQGWTELEMQVPCTFDFNVAVTKYFHGLADGEIPLCLMFSGTIFYADLEGAVQVSPISWSKETRFALPLRVWKEMMDAHYPNSAWLCLNRDVVDRLSAYKSANGIMTWDQAMEDVLDAAEGVVNK